MNIESKRPSVKCKVFKDNNGVIELAKAPKICPRTKHIALKYIITSGNRLVKA